MASTSDRVSQRLQECAEHERIRDEVAEGARTKAEIFEDTPHGDWLLEVADKLSPQKEDGRG